MNKDSSIEKLVELKLIQEDAGTILSLMKSEHDSIFGMGIIPYYALFVQSCQDCLHKEGSISELVKSCRNYIKVFEGGFSKSKRRVSSVDKIQNMRFQSMLRFRFMKSWNIHYNLGIYWTNNKHMIGNTQMYADYLGLANFSNDSAAEKLYELGYEIGKYVASVNTAFGQFKEPSIIERTNNKVEIQYYYDLNTNKKNLIFLNNSKDLSLFYLNLVCSINFVRYILEPLFLSDNNWLFRVEYIVTYYTYRALERLSNYCENNNDIIVDRDALMSVLDLDFAIFDSKLRSSMMHYGIKDEGVISLENIDNPLYGMIETCFGGMSFKSYYSNLRKLEDRLIKYLEGQFNSDQIYLKKL